ncbi:Beta-1,3-glucan-binding protein [Papilio xuthus]|uniref:Beta-1,3-glucan-binding protein n=1 Tax=Papilio xuthus TaxID=66420 RepID=A0A194PV45_PAPXU|nr:Beta-1,3-glucan-binding protein [Papilio xuthus]
MLKRTLPCLFEESPTIIGRFINRFIRPPNDPETERTPNTFDYGSCQLSKSKTSVPGFVCKGQLLFEDNFNSDLNEGMIWTSEVKMPVQPDYPFNLYEDRAEVKDGKLLISPITLASKYGSDFVRRSISLRHSCTGSTYEECNMEAFGPQILPPAITAKITTRNTFSFKYGRIEVGAKMPIGDWLIPLIQLEPRDNVYGSLNYASGLIRIACVKGNMELSKKLYGGAIVGHSEPLRSRYLREKQNNQQWSKSFHNFTLVWSPDEIVMYVDGENYGRVKPPNGFFEDVKKLNTSTSANWVKGSNMAPLDEMFYVSIGLDVGGVHEFQDSPNKPWKNSSNKAMLEFWNARHLWYPTWTLESVLSVDYIRIYAL